MTGDVSVSPINRRADNILQCARAFSMGAYNLPIYSDTWKTGYWFIFAIGKSIHAYRNIRLRFIVERRKISRSVQSDTQTVLQCSFKNETVSYYSARKDFIDMEKRDYNISIMVKVSFKKKFFYVFNFSKFARSCEGI